MTQPFDPSDPPTRGAAGDRLAPGEPLLRRRPPRGRVATGGAGRPWTRHWRWPAAVVVVVALLLAALVFRQPLADALWPQARVQALLQQADAALARGHLDADDGSGARALYEAAQAIDPDRGEPRAGLARVAEAALARARVAVAGNRFADAHRDLALARALSVPRAPADAVAATLRAREAAHAGLDGLLARAAAASASGHLADSEDAALPLYRRVLELDPGHGAALRGREDALGELLSGARARLRDGDLAGAAAAIATARRYDAGHVDLPDTAARLAEEADALRRRSAAAVARGRLDDAEAGYRSLLQLDAGDADATAGLARVGAAHAARAERAASDFDFAGAEAALAKAAAIAPDGAELAETRRHLERARQARAQLAGGPPTRERTRRVQALLAQARESEARGDLLSPPGDSAYDRVRAARALAPDDASVRAASARLLPAAIDCFERALRDNALARARGCLDARTPLGDRPATVAAATRLLAQRWLAVGEQRLGAGDVAGAAAALATARDIDPGAPGIDEFAARLHAASPGG